ncbi:MAG TPA: hypothetical protein VLV18_02445, partial [Terriglobales bacterium]|nr:hypothetical protein [Terriglobales bacterium]
MKRKASILFPITLFCLSWAVPLQATTYTVKAGGGGNYTTISACAAAAQAGDTCVVYAGTYTGWAESHNGSAGSPITFIANTGDTVNLSSGVTISGSSYITLSGFHFTQGGVVGSSSSTHNVISHNSTVGSPIFVIPHNTGSGGTDNYIGYNTVNLTGTTDVNGMDVYGDRNLMEHNEVYGGDSDCHDVGGTNVVVRYEYCHDMVGPAQHIDFVQVVGAGYTP